MPAMAPHEESVDGARIVWHVQQPAEIDSLVSALREVVRQAARKPRSEPTAPGAERV